MSDRLIRQDGDEIAAKVPAIKTLQGDYGTFGTWLARIAGVDFAGDAKDEATLYAKATFHQIMTAFGKIYTSLGTAIGVQGDRLDAVRQIGDQTESGASSHASGWSGGAKG
ncbi:ESX-1 secretion-associated protein [Frankia sp. AiPs1]|uniref:hypothetical protein n=1 Tax=Frankia sp. AiPa1 TaxID=573492 RepID=UPI00202B5B54|nr:hypothetical protein [Frankia sp. AiPa1]MCL9762488.1 hypothetical protein [Frankia sp. AiPa1]